MQIYTNKLNKIKTYMSYLDESITFIVKIENETMGNITFVYLY
jgi:hypothetical protein